MRKPYNHEYHRQKDGARRRNIDWQFTYDTWIEWWGSDIVYRGKGPGKLVMSRNGDTGPYSIENCKKITHSQNCSDGQKGKPKPLGFAAKARQSMLGKVNNPYGCKGKVTEMTL
jgi:hypothetical protein